MLNVFVTNIFSFIHALTMCFKACEVINNRILRKNWDVYADEPLEYEYQKFFAFSLSYFIMDTITGFVCNYNKPAMILHHVLLIALLVHQLVSNNEGIILFFMYGIGEVSSILLFPYENLRMFPLTRKISSGFGLVFCLVFLFARIILGTILFLVVNSLGYVNVFMKIMTIPAVYVGWFWSW